MAHACTWQVVSSKPDTKSTQSISFKCSYALVREHWDSWEGFCTVHTWQASCKGYRPEARDQRLYRLQKSTSPSSVIAVSHDKTVFAPLGRILHYSHLVSLAKSLQYPSPPTVVAVSHGLTRDRWEILYGSGHNQSNDVHQWGVVLEQRLIFQ
jgi:hypothetical protein